MLNISYGDSVTLDFDALPEVSRIALATGGLAHKLGNEVSAAVIGQFRKQARDAYKAAYGDEKKLRDDQELPCWKDLTSAQKTDLEKMGDKKSDSDEYIALKKELQDEALQNLIDGKVRESAGPRLSPFEAKVQQITVQETINILKGVAKGHKAFGKMGTKIPDDDAVFNLKGKDWTFAALCTSRYEKNKVRIDREAQKFLDDQKKKAEAHAAIDIDDAFGLGD